MFRLALSLTLSTLAYGQLSQGVPHTYDIQIGPTDYTFKLTGPAPRLTQGIVRRITATHLVIEADDHRILWFRMYKLRLNREQLPPGQRIAVIAQTGDDGISTAFVADSLGPGTPEDVARAERTWDLPDLEALGKRNEKPKLSRGKPFDPPEQSPVPGIAAEYRELVQTTDPVLQKAALASQEFLSSLPSFSVQREVIRVLKTTTLELPLDTVTADLIFSAGRERFTNTRRNHKKVKVEDLPGLRTNGEFGELLAYLFARQTSAKFTRIRNEDLDGRPSWRYNFEVERDNSRWKIFNVSEHYFAAYGGTIWIDRETSRVMRLEMQARDLPKAFTFDRAELNVVYSSVTLAEGAKFILPTQAEALSCIRGQSACERNQTTFLHYTKYDAKSTIEFQRIR